MNNEFNLDELDNQINKLRRLMILTATVHGIGSMETLRCSQDLDKLIIQSQLQHR